MQKDARTVVILIVVVVVSTSCFRRHRRIDGAMRPRGCMHAVVINQPASFRRNSQSFWTRKESGAYKNVEGERKENTNTDTKLSTRLSLSVITCIIYNFVCRRTTRVSLQTYDGCEIFLRNFIMFYCRSGKFSAKMRETARYDTGVSRACF